MSSRIAASALCGSATVCGSIATRTGRALFQTKGDANETADPWTFTLDERTQARAAFDVPYVGYVLSVLSIREARMAVIGIPALLIAFAVLAGFRREVRRAGIAPEARS